MGNRYERKRRTRNHIIEGLSRNYLERLVLLNGFSCEYFDNDYGIDANIYTYNPTGLYEDGYIGIQLKSTDNINIISNGTEISFTLDKRDINYWLRYLMPVILVLYDAKKDNAYWLYIQRYFQQIPNFELSQIPANFNVRIPTKNILDKSAIMAFRDFKNNILSQNSNNFISHA